MAKQNEPNENPAHEPTDPVEAAFAKLGKERRFSIGDLVRFDGRLYFIDAYQFEAERRGDHHAEEITYQLEAVYARDSWDFDVACDDELEFVADCAQASEWLRNNGAEEAPQEAGSIVIEFTFGDGGAAKKPVESKHRDVEKAEIRRRKRYRARVDELMDGYNAAKAAGEDDAAASIRREYEREALIYGAGGAEGGVNPFEKKMAKKSAKEDDEK